MDEIENQNGLDQTDSFDDMKVEPINMEPVFSTASGTRIDVKAESIEKSKQLFQKDQANNKKFMSPVVKSHGNAFISPFRSSGPSPLKRPAEEKAEEISSKKEKPSTSVETCEVFGRILRIEEIHEENERRFVILEKSTKRKILARGNLENNSSLKVFDTIKIDKYQKIRENEDIKIDEILLQPMDTSEIIAKHSFASFPYTREPCFIHELRPKDGKDMQTAVLKVNIVDFGPKFYQGCSKCQYRFNSKKQKNAPIPEKCPKCGETAENRKCIYSIMRIVDLSGQLEIHVPHEIMQNFLRMLGYHDVKEMDKFSNLQEQMNYVFKPIMVRIRRRNREEWIAEEFDNVDWEGFSKVLERRFAEENMKIDVLIARSESVNLPGMKNNMTGYFQLPSLSIPSIYKPMEQ